jgi:hypothetical protein
MLSIRFAYCTVLVGSVLLSPLAVFAGGAAPSDPARLTGAITDSKGKPVSGARVSVARRSGERAGLDRLTAVTNKDGKFNLPVSVPAGKPFVVREVWVEKSGYVRAENNQQHDLRPGATVALDLRLVRGEPIAGHVEVPLSLTERKAGVKSTDRQFALVVVGPFFARVVQHGERTQGITADGKTVTPAFVQTHFTAKGGNFKLWAPKGDYAVLVRSLSPAGVAVHWTKVQSGARSLVLRNPFLSEAELARAFDDLWDEMDRHYSYFFLKKDVDWTALKDHYRPRALQAVGLFEFSEVLADMLGHLEDMHIWLDTPEGRVATFANPGRGNQNQKMVLAGLEAPIKCGDFAIAGKTKADGFGYFLLTKQGAANTAAVQQAARALRALSEAPGFVVDLREAEGGNEAFALEIARLFCAKDSVYARSKYRNGKKHDEFGQVFDRVLPATPHAYGKPVVCLFGQRSVSSGEAFVQMMKCLPQVTTVGEPTRGASGNPKPFRLPGIDVTVWFSRWVDLMPDGAAFEGQGITPDVLVESPPESYQDRDPTLERALEVLRQKVWDVKNK